MRTNLLLAAGIMVSAALMPWAAGAETITKACKLGAMKAKAADNEGVATTLNNYSNIPNTAVRFVQGSGSNCVIVRFSGEARAEGTRTLIRAVMDGTTFIARPADVQFTESFSFEAHAFEFVFTGIPAGKHTVVMQWQSSDFGQESSMEDRTTVVEYAP